MNTRTDEKVLFGKISGFIGKLVIHKLKVNHGHFKYDSTSIYFRLLNNWYRIKLERLPKDHDESRDSKK